VHVSDINDEFGDARNDSGDGHSFPVEPTDNGKHICDGLHHTLVNFIFIYSFCKKMNFQQSLNAQYMYDHENVIN